MATLARGDVALHIYTDKLYCVTHIVEHSTSPDPGVSIRSMGGGFNDTHSRYELSLWHQAGRQTDTDSRERKILRPLH